MQLERRQSPRRKLDHLAYINLPAANGGRVLDVSEGGLSFHSVAPIEPAGAVIFRLAVGGIRDIEGIATVAWTDETRKSGGLRFTDLPSGIRGQIQGWLEEADVPPSPAPRAIPLGAPHTAAKRATEPDVANEVVDVRHTEERAERDIEPVAAQQIEPALLDARERFGAAVESSEPVAESPPEPPVQPILSFGATAVETTFPPVAPRNPLSMFPTESGATDQEVPHRGHGFSIVAAIVLLACVVATGTLSYVYRGNAGSSVIWLGQKISGRSHAEAVPSAPAVSEPHSVSAPPQGAPAPEGAKPSTSPEAAHQTVVGQAVAGSASQGSAENGAATTNSEAATPEDPGASELALARKYLREGQGPEDSATAAQLLWVSVEKGNTNAEVELAGLYARGQGVQKSCEQARVLLTAAASKGNPEAKAKLDELLHAGCS
jgi:hypothetical protein